MRCPYSRPAALPQFMAGRPLVPISLYHAGYEETWPALVDSGATFSVLPYDIGLQVGFVWGEKAEPFALGGIYKNMQAIMVLVRGEIAGLPPMALGFAWVEKSSDDVMLILGQTNFFQRFKVTFEAYHEAFDISPLPPER
jgi:hypothetical protein